MGLYDTVTAVTVGGTENQYIAKELKVDMHPKLLTAYAPLTALTSVLTRIGDTSSFNYRVDWIEKKEMPHVLVVATTESAAGSTIYVVDNGDTLVKDSLLYNPRVHDLRLVDANETDNTIGVTVDQGGLTSTIWKSGDILHILPPALDENDEGFRAKSVVNANVYNLHQLVKLQYGLTRVGNRMATHWGGAGSKREEMKVSKYLEYRIKKEKLLYFGGRDTSGTAPATKRMAGGLVHYLRSGTLYKDFNGIFTESGFRNFVGDYKSQNPDATEIWAFCAGNVIDLMTMWGLDKVRLTPLSKTYGLNIYDYIARGITIHMVALPLLDVPVTEGWGFLLDLQRIRLKTLDRDAFYPDAKSVGESEIIYDTYRGVYTLMVANESRHAMFVGALL